MNGSSDRDVAVFAEAIQLSVGDRPTYLDRACGGDEELRQRVERLLKVHDQAGDFLEQPAPGAVPETDAEISIGEKPGDRIGRYKLLQQIGEGGWGVVFMAEQEEPVRRRVALKIIKPGMDTKSVMVRFEAERQALALMDHPNIAKVFDAGATESGRPYFVMELVKGVKITDYCDRKSLTTEERLGLFVQVCRAVQHAHQKGIIHRDIKPSNILVTTTEEGSALPVVIDFGIAKATTNQRLTDKTLFTAFEMLIGTPAYMSPEQADLGGVDVDTRTDVYSLGVLLYELVTGSTPFDAGSLLKAGLDEIRQVIRERDPDRPSVRLSAMAAAELTATAQHRQSAPPALIHSVRGDLDWIVMKALEKDRTRRYETVNGLALDVQRYLANEPILARPPSSVYRFRKMVRRNQLLFAGVGIITLLLVASLIVVSASLARERRSRREAEAAKAKAEAASVKSQQVTKFLEDMLQGVGPSVARGRDTTMLREILDQTAERVGNEMTNQPAVQAELRALIGRLYQEIGNFDRAEEMDRAALAIDRKTFGPESPQVAATLNELGRALMSRNKLTEAEGADREALAVRRQLFGNENTDTATSLNDLSAVYRQEGRLAEAEPMAREALGIRKKLFGDESLEVADSLRNLSVILGDEREWAESEAMAREVLAIRRKQLGPEHPWVAYSLEDVAWAAGAMGKSGEADELEQESLVMRVKLLGGEHPDVAKSLYLVGDRMRRKGDLNEADSFLSAALAVQRKALDKGNPDLLYTLNSLGLTLEAEGNLADAEQTYREALAGGHNLGEEETPLVLSTLNRLGSTLEAEGKWPEAETVYREELALWRKQAGDEAPQTLYTLGSLGSTLEAEGKLAESEQVRSEALAVWRKQGKNETPEALSQLDSLTRLLIAQKKYGDAEQLLSEALTPAFVGQPSSANFLDLRVELEARHSQWQAAAADAALAMEYDPFHFTRFPIAAALLIKTDNRPAYEQLRGKIIATFASTTNFYVADQVAKACLFRPPAETDLPVLGRLADSTVTQGTGDSGAMPFFEICKALSEYRQRHFAEAVEWAQKSVESPRVDAHGHSYAVLAMADWQLGRKDEARAALDEGNALEPSMMPSSTAEDPGSAWLAWLYARIQLDEAATLVKPPASAPRR